MQVPDDYKGWATDGYAAVRYLSKLLRISKYEAEELIEKTPELLDPEVLGEFTYAMWVEAKRQQAAGYMMGQTILAAARGLPPGHGFVKVNGEWELCHQGALYALCGPTIVTDEEPLPF